MPTLKGHPGDPGAGDGGLWRRASRRQVSRHSSGRGAASSGRRGATHMGRLGSTSDQALSLCESCSRGTFFEATGALHAARRCCCQLPYEFSPRLARGAGDRQTRDPRPPPSPSASTYHLLLPLSQPCRAAMLAQLYGVRGICGLRGLTY